LDTLELRFPPSSRYVRVAAQMAANLGKVICRNIEESARDPNFIATLELVVSEVCTNAVKHGAQFRKDAEIVMLIMVDEQAMTITVKDCNKSFDFSAICEPDLENHPECGYGIFLMREFMDEVLYVRENGWNSITLVKYNPCYKR